MSLLVPACLSVSMYVIPVLIQVSQSEGEASWELLGKCAVQLKVKLLSTFFHLLEFQRFFGVFGDADLISIKIDNDSFFIVVLDFSHRILQTLVVSSC
jgi:hypothetical protein